MPIQCTCEACGTTFYRKKPSSVGAHTYCSRPCALAPKTTPVTFSDDGAYALIPLRARDGSVRAYTLVDAADAEFTNQWRWSLSPSGYAERSTRISGKPCRFSLHRELLGLKTGDTLHVDHISRDTLDNRRANLRTVTNAQNAQNRANKRGSVSRYRGVTWKAANRCWTAQIWVNQKHLSLGSFASEEAAAEAARSARAIHMPYAID